MNLEDVIDKIKEHLIKQQHVVVAVSGFGGSGKTTMAEKIMNSFDSSTWVQLDNFLINHGQGEGWAGGYDWERFESVLKNIKIGNDLHYQWYDWHKDDLSEGWIDEKLPQVIVVEGCRILQPQLMQYYDLSVWIDVDLETATKRGIARDRKSWQNKSDQQGLEEHLSNWPNVWVPKDKEYADKFHPEKLTDFVIPNS
ncbi:MAG: uridine kinase family protein [Candidatus Saccharimonadales bacterium]